MTDPIEKLRELEGQLVGYGNGMYGPRYEELEGLADEIMAAYIKLPVDSDGEPWHIGDVTENGNMVKAITFDRLGAHFSGMVNDIDPSIHVHFKPRTLEDVLADVRDGNVDTGDAAGEIRELLGGDA